MTLSFTSTLFILLAEHILLFPIIYSVKGAKSKILGTTFLFCMNVSFFFFRPFWHVKIIKPPPRISDICSKPTLIVVNHQSKVDPWVLTNCLVGLPATYVVKKSLLNVPIAGWALRLSNPLSVSFTKAKGGWGTEAGNVIKLMEDTWESLKSGVCVIVYPEGTRSATGRLQPFKDGFFRFCTEHPGVRILPVGMHNNCSMWPLGSPYLDEATSYVSFGDYIETEGLTAEQLREKTRNTIFSLLECSPIFNPEKEQMLNEIAKERGHGL